MTGAPESIELSPPYVEKLRRNISAEVVRALGLPANGPLTRPLDWITRVPTHRFAEVGARFDAFVRHYGFSEAAKRILPVFCSGFRAVGGDRIPSEGPLLIASNHPGTCDSLVLAASSKRDDIKIVAGDIPFLMNLPSARESFIFASMDTHQRMSVMRSAIRHLRDGGALLLFPSGTIDPDAAVLPGARQALRKWSRSAEVMLRRAPDAHVVVAIVSGVLARACAQSPLTRLRVKAQDRQRIAEFIQVMQQMVLGRSLDVVPDVTFAEPLTTAELGGDARFERVTDALTWHAQQLFSHHAARVLA